MAVSGLEMLTETREEGLNESGTGIVAYDYDL